MLHAGTGKYKFLTITGGLYSETRAERRDCPCPAPAPAPKKDRAERCGSCGGEGGGRGPRKVKRAAPSCTLIVRLTALVAATPVVGPAAKPSLNPRASKFKEP
jgi:hypothetical protein